MCVYEIFLHTQTSLAERVALKRTKLLFWIWLAVFTSVEFRADMSVNTLWIWSCFEWDICIEVGVILCIETNLNTFKWRDLAYLLLFFTFASPLWKGRSVFGATCTYFVAQKLCNGFVDLALGLHENDWELNIRCAKSSTTQQVQIPRESKLLMGLFFPDSSLWVTHPKRIGVLSHLSHRVREPQFEEIHMQHKRNQLLERLSDLFISWVGQSYFRELSHLFIHSSAAQQEGRGRGRWVESQCRN